MKTLLQKVLVIVCRPKTGWWVLFIAACLAALISKQAYDKTIARPAKDEQRQTASFPRPVAREIPEISTPEAKRVVRDLQRVYAGDSTSNKTKVADILSKITSGAAGSLEHSSTLLRQTVATLPDADYVNAVLPAILNPHGPAGVVDLLYQDLSTRPNTIRLRTLFLIAGIEAHPLAATALKDLQAILRTDYEQNWSRWDQAISQQLFRENRGSRGQDCRTH
jgi:hypothetical protein